jgi:hypothetical protein
LQILDMLVSGAVETAPLDTPPSSPAAGSCYIVGPAPSGAWSGKAGQIAGYSAGGWRFVAPAAGMELFIKSSGLGATYRSGAWEIGVTHTGTVAVGGQTVVGARQAAIANPSGGSTVDANARGTIGNILAALRAHGLIEP